MKMDSLYVTLEIQELCCGEVDTLWREGKGGDRGRGGGGRAWREGEGGDRGRGRAWERGERRDRGGKRERGERI